MKIDIISDIHLDFWLKRGNEKEIDLFIKRIIKPLNSEVLIIAGDLGHYNAQNIKFLNLISQMYEKIFLVFGNHDLYLVSRKQKDKYKLSINRIMELKQNLPSNVTFLDGDTQEYNGVKFAGCGMWYEVNEENLNRWFETMNDAAKIYEDKIFHIDIDSYGRKRVYRFNPIEFYKNELKKLQNISNADVLISHVAPYLSEKEEFYFFEGENEIKRINPTYWIFGHKHIPYDFYYNNTRLIANPLGYKNQNKNFKLKTVEIKD